MPTRGTSERGNDVEHVGGLDAVLSEMIAAHIDPQHRQPAGGRDLDIVAAGDSCEHPLDLQRQLPEHFEVGTVNEDGDVALDACHQLVDPHLDRLAEAELDAGHVLREQLVHFLDQGIASQARAPLVLGFEHGPDVGLVHAHHVVGDLGPAGLAVDHPHFGNRSEQLLDLGGNGHGPLERGGGNSHGLDQQIALVEPGHELAPHVPGDRHARGHQPSGQQERDQRMANEQVEHRRVQPLDPADQPDLLLLGVVAEAKRGHHRHERERQDQRAGQGEDHRQGHRPEQLSFRALKREDRQIDDRDDQLAEHGRLADLDGGIANDLELGPRSTLVGQPAHAVLDHDHAGVDDQAEVDRTQAHQAGRHAGGEHDVGREQHRQRNRQRDDQAAPQVPEHGQQHRR